MGLNKLFFIGIILFCSSCVSKKDIYYFQDIEGSYYENEFTLQKIQPGDILDLQIKALDPQSVQIFKRQPDIMSAQQQIQNRAIDGYVVGEDRNISIPILGVIDTSDHTTQSLAIAIQEELSSYIKSPSVNVRLLNFRFSVLGEVANPGTFTSVQERVSLPQALGRAGDLTINGDRNHVLLIRNQDGQKLNKVIDLTKSEFLQTEFYFVKQNDIIYVRPNNAKVKSSGLVGNASTLVSILSLAVSLFIVITR